MVGLNIQISSLINNNELNLEVEIFPLTSNQLVIKTGIPTNCEIYLNNALGQTLFTSNIVLSAGKNPVTIPAISKGIYWITLKTSQNIITKSFLFNP